MSGISNPKSNCCQAPIKIAGGGEGTYHYECTKCHKACDIWSAEKHQTTQSSKLDILLKKHFDHDVVYISQERRDEAKAAILELMRAEINDIDAWGHDFLCNVGDHNIHTELVAKGCNCGTGRICKKLIDNLEKL